MKALFSIHDVMPETLSLVREQLAMLAGHGHRQVCLLVVPGKNWQSGELAQLQRWQDEGLELAAHGWHHHCQRFGGLYHRLHAALISKRCAEHLALSGAEIAKLMSDSRSWFAGHGLEPPSTYVPPAWALGRINGGELQATGFERVEVLSGLLDVARQCLHKLPLVGFEADARWRAAFLRPFNLWQQRRARVSGQALRIGLHPRDHHLYLRAQLEAFIAQPAEDLRYDAALPTG